CALLFGRWQNWDCLRFHFRDGAAIHVKRWNNSDAVAGREWCWRRGSLWDLLLLVFRLMLRFGSAVGDLPLLSVTVGGVFALLSSFFFVGCCSIADAL
ncbi:hypothetical protein Ancab_017151, partial [Ancistrocladus abbreviatus]